MDIYIGSNDRISGGLANATYNINWSNYEDCMYMLECSLISQNFNMTGSNLNGSLLIMTNLLDGISESNKDYNRILGIITFGAILYNSGGKLYSKTNTNNPIYLRGRPFNNTFFVNLMNSGDRSIFTNVTTPYVLTLSFKKINPTIEFPIGRNVKRLFLNSEDGVKVSGVRNNINYSFSLDIVGKYIVSQCFQMSKSNINTPQNIPLLIYTGWNILNTFGIRNSGSCNVRSLTDAMLYIYPYNNRFIIDEQISNTVNLKLIDPITNSLWTDGSGTVKEYGLDLLFYPI